MLKKIVPIILTISIFVSGMTSLSYAATAPSAARSTAPVVTVSGQSVTVSSSSSVTVDPDMATIVLGVQTSGKDLKKVTDENTKLITKVQSAIKALGIKQIETSNIFIYPMYDYSDKGGQILNGYNVSNNLTITVNDLSKVSKIVDSAMDAGANSVNQVSFFKKDDEPSYQKALKQAIEKSKSRAQASADAAGLKLGKVISISDSSSPYSPTPFYNNTNVVMDSGMEKSQIGETIQPNKITITSDVVVTYELLAK